MFRAPLCPSSGVQGCTLLHMVFSTVKDTSYSVSKTGYQPSLKTYKYWDRSFSKQFSFFCPYQPLFVLESEDIFTLNANKTVYPVLNLLYHKQHSIKQRSIQNCSQYVKGTLHFCASVTNYHSCVPTIICHYFIIN